MSIILMRHVSLGVANLMIVCSGLSQQVVDGQLILREQQERELKKQAEYRALYDRLPNLDITGRVVDQFGDSVPSAKVTIFWENADELLGKVPKRREETVKTDSQGCFKLRCSKPIDAKAEAEKEGYARLSGTARNLVRVRDQMPEVFPATITLRKRGESSFLLYRSRTGGAWVWMYTNKTGKVSADLLVGIAGGQRSLTRCEDFCANISYDAVKKCWAIDYAVAREHGIICSDECLYEAPLSGYTNTVTLVVPDATEKNVKYLYLRTRSPAIYSRIELNHDTSNDSSLGPFLRIFREEICVNPYGERNLEYDDRFMKGWRAREELTQEAVSALIQGRYPEKCKDIPARIKEASDRR